MHLLRLFLSVPTNNSQQSYLQGNPNEQLLVFTEDFLQRIWNKLTLKKKKITLNDYLKLETKKKNPQNTLILKFQSQEKQNGCSL